MGEHTPDEPRLAAFTERRSLREQVIEALRVAVVAGEMRPGIVYSAPALADRLGVSPTPVREAMLDLAREGMVTAVRNKGFRVTELSERQLDEYTAVRELIEAPTVARIAANAPREALEELRPLAVAVVTTAEQRDFIDYIKADLRFHLELLALAGNEQLVEVVRDLRHRSRLYGVPALARRGELAASSYEHVELLDVIIRGDAAEADTMTRHHLRKVRGIWASPVAGRAQDGEAPSTGE